MSNSANSGPEATNSPDSNVQTQSVSAPRVVILGGGHAGAQLCAALHELGISGATHLVCEEAVLPYHRPPLSKAFLKTEDAAQQAHRSAAWFETTGVRTHLGDAAVRIDRATRQVHLKSGVSLPYDFLVLATGTRARALPGLASGLTNAFALRTLGDANALRSKLHAASHVTVLGGGFIGLEVAATAQTLGKTVTVIEMAPRLMGRSVSAELAEFVLETHRTTGITIKLNAKLGGYHYGKAPDGSPVVKAIEVDGQREAVELLLIGIGAQPEQALALDADLECDNGVVVDASLRTSDPIIFAIGDCCSFPLPDGARVRLESVQNANDQARAVAKQIAQSNSDRGLENIAATSLGPYNALPWFWSEQGSLRLQMAGLLPKDAQSYRRPGASTASFSILHYQADKLRCVESVNAAQDHLAARKLLEAGISPAPTAATDPSLALKSFF
jgi:3-phenylpropionate/trans-cinnamate dioxygenase ferredoxin reductase component